jgi:putative membrane protein
VFDWLQREGAVAEREMWRTFNCGIGFVLVLTVVGLGWLWWHDRRWPLRPTHFALICAFIVAHCIGARWLYSYVPYDDLAADRWSAGRRRRRSAGSATTSTASSICCTVCASRPPFGSWLRQRVAVAVAWDMPSCVTVMLIMCTSLVYEWLEWGIALTMSPEAAESYNGQQGDVWDAHADMLLATVGSPAGMAPGATRAPRSARMTARIAVLASGRGSNLQCLLDGIAAGTLNARSSACSPTSRPPPRWTRSRLKSAGHARRGLFRRDAFDAALATRWPPAAPDWVVCAGYMRILGAGFVQRFAGRLVNIHPSLLPRHKGLHTHARAIEAGDAEHGASVHFVVP